MSAERGCHAEAPCRCVRWHRHEVGRPRLSPSSWSGPSEQSQRSHMTLYTALQCPNCQLRWRQSNLLGTKHELRADGKQIASLHFRDPFDSTAAAQSADGAWEFRRADRGLTRVMRRIDQAGTDTEIAVFSQNAVFGGELRLHDGRRLPAVTYAWLSRLEFRNERDEDLVGFEPTGLFRLSATVSVRAPPSCAQELPLLVMLGWYLLGNDIRRPYDRSEIRGDPAPARPTVRLHAAGFRRQTHRWTLHTEESSIGRA